MQPYYQDEWTTIYHGDCAIVMDLLDPVDLVFADPPYGVDLQLSGGYDDHEDTTEGYWEWLEPLVTTIIAKSDVALFTSGIGNLWRYPKPKWVVAWGKPGSTRRSYLGGFNCWEPVLIYGKPEKRVYQDLYVLPDVANHSQDTGDHPCPKPVKLLTWLIENFSEPGNLVLDPFLGSGTTTYAAKQLGRRSIGIEKSEHYCEIAARRLAQGVLELG